LPELVPFVSQRDKILIRDVYMPAQLHKALAVGLEYIGFVSGQPTQKMADDAAVDACTKRTNAARAAAGLGPVRVCEVYASGNVVVTKRGQPPMPPEPWLIRDPSVERPFIAADLPLVSAAWKEDAAKHYPSLRKSKAYVVSPTGGHSYFSWQPSPEEAIRRALERCGYEAGVPCMVVAVDDSFVVPIPTSAKVVGLYRPAALTAVLPGLRQDVARRLANAISGWNAVAVGAGGHVGLKVGALSEQAAVDASLEACRTQDRDCRLAVLGPFLVEREPERTPERGATP
jgi:adenylate cyclase